MTTYVTGSSLDDTITSSFHTRLMIADRNASKWKIWGKLWVENSEESYDYSTSKRRDWYSYTPDDEGESWDVEVDSGDGDDYIDLERWADAIVTAGADNDTIKGYRGSFDGGSGDDYIQVRKDNDWSNQTVYAYGDSGTDTLDISNFTKGSVTIDLDVGSTLDLEGNREVIQDGTFENYIGVSGDDYVTASSSGSVISTGEGNDTLIGRDGNDYLDAGDVNTGDNDVITTGGGWDIVYLGDLGSDDKDYSQSPADLSIWAALNVDSEDPDAEETSIFDDIDYEEVISTALKMVPTVGKYLSFGFELVTWLTDTSKEKDVTASDMASETEVTDFDPRYDMVVMPVLSLDHVRPVITDTVTYVEFELEGDNGDYFLTMYLDESFITDFEALFNYNVNDEVFTKSIWDNLWDARVTFDNTSSEANPDGVITAYQGSEALTGYDDVIETFLDTDQHMMLFGNVAGYYVDVASNAPFVAGSAQNDVFTLDDSVVTDYAAFFIAGFEGDDLLILDNGSQSVKFDGGTGEDIVSFYDLYASNDNDDSIYTAGVIVDLGNGSDQVFAGDGEIKLTNVEGVEGTDYGDVLTGSSDDNIFFGQDGNDTISGMDGYDTLIGGDGDDYLSGGNGDDYLTGGGGIDTFVFSDDGSTDTVADINVNDTLLLTSVSSADDVSFTSYSNDTGSWTEISFGISTILLEGELLDATYFEFSVTDSGLEMTKVSNEDNNTVICTHMNARGFIPDDVYRWDAHYGVEVLGPTVLRGYHFWAVPLVEHVLENSDLATRLLAPAAQAWAQEMAHRCDPANHPQGAMLGRVILTLGVPLCYGLGRVLEALEPEAVAAR